MSRPFLGILGSGKGSNFEAIHQAIQEGKLNAEIKVAISDRAESSFLQKAQHFKIPNFWFDTRELEKQAIALLKEFQVDLIILAGFMRILSPSFVRAFPNRILNIHPALLPKFRGKEAWKKAFESGEKEAGCTVHIVTEQVDKGPVLAQRKVLILPNDSPDSIYHKIQIQERLIYSEAIANYWKELQ